MDILLKQFLASWANVSGNVSSVEGIQNWVDEKNRLLRVDVNKISLKDCGDWFYDYTRGVIRNSKGSFFSISGIQEFYNEKLVKEQPIIIQNEIGFLGIICKIIDGVLNFLMQAKIEPGNINKVQISPTIQATKSNFTQKHGGRQPAYLDSI